MESSSRIDVYKVWDDGFSPIAFALLNKQEGSVNDAEFLHEIFLHSKRLTRKFGKCYILINLSFIGVSKEGLNFIKEVKKRFTRGYVAAVAIVGFDGMKFKLNLEDSDYRSTKIRTFNVFEDALRFVNEHRKNYG